MGKSEKKPAINIEELILDEIGVTLRRETRETPETDLTPVIEKHEKWFREIAKRIKQQAKDLQELKAQRKTWVYLTQLV